MRNPLKSSMLRSGGEALHVNSMVWSGFFWADLGFLDAEFLENEKRYIKSILIVFNSL